MNRQLKISPSILSADYGNLESAARDADRAGGAAIHIDIMDGHYVHNFSFGIDVIPALKKKTGIPLVAHLEIDNPDAFIADFADAGADMIVVQEDTCPHLPRTVQAIRRTGKKAGIGINPDRGFEKIEANPEILKQIELFIVMAVYPGFGGQPFSPTALPKIKKAVLMRDRYGADYDIGVDGAVGKETVPGIVAAGANYLIAGSSAFGGGDVIKNVETLRALAEKALVKSRRVPGEYV
ncbi:MAG: ribulose-phosphate 3-epimerase [Spirochaetes bacterium]|nr:ribulose-phosphate 3-epimerase [Spirochaetota bacterium]